MKKKTFDEFISEARGNGQGVGGELQGDGGANVCKCPECGKEYIKEKGKPCNETKCPKCNVTLVGEAIIEKFEKGDKVQVSNRAPKHAGDVGVIEDGKETDKTYKVRFGDDLVILNKTDIIKAE